jgi:polar amino acid transport system substrate-binding protein
MLKLFGTLVLSSLLFSGSASAQQAITLMASTSPPYSDEKLPDQGLAMSVVSQVFQLAGYQPDIQFESWSRAMEGVSVGVYEALAAVWYTDERAKEYLFSEPYLSSQLILLKLRSDPTRYADASRLAGKRLGTQVDFAYGVDFDQIRGLRLVPENHAIQNLLGLLNGSVDVVIGDQRTLSMQITNYLPKERHKFEVVDANLPTRARHVAVSRAIEGEEKIIADFNRALATARKNGSYAAIVAEWDKRYSLD